MITARDVRRLRRSVHLSYWRSADSVTFESIPGFDNDFGTLAFEWYLR